MSAVDEGHAELLAKDEEIARLKKELEQVTNERNAKDPQITQITDKLTGAQKEVVDRDTKIATLQAQLAKFEAEVAIEREKNAQYLDMEKLLRSQLETREKEFAELDLRVEEAQRALKPKDEQIAELRQETTHLRIELEAEKNNVVEWRSRFNTYQEVDRSKLDEEITRLSGRLHEMAIELEKRVVSVATLQEERRALEDRLKQEQNLSKVKDARVKAILEEMSTFSQKIQDADNLRRTADENARAKALQASLLEKRLSDLSFQLKEKDDSLKHLHQSLDAARKQLRTVEEESVQRLKNLTAKTSELSHKEIELQHAKRLAELETKDKAGFKQLADSQQKTLEEERRKRTDAELALIPLRTKVTELELEVAELNLNIKSLEAQNERHEITVNLLTDRNASLEANQVNLIAAEKRALDECGKAKEELSAVLEQKALGYDGALERTERDLKLANKVNESTSERVDALKAQIEKLRTALQEREVSLQQSLEKIKTLETVTLADKDHQIEDLEGKTAAAEAKASAAEKHLELIKQKAEELQKAVVEQSARAEDLHTQLTVAQDKLDAEVEKARGLDLKIKELTLTLEGDRKRKQMVDDIVKDLRTRIAEQAKQLFEKEQDIDVLKETNEVQVEEVETLKAQIESLKHDIKILTEEKLTISTRLKVAEVELKAKAEHSIELQGKIKDLRQQLHEKDQALYDMSKNLDTINAQAASAQHRANMLEKGGTALTSELTAKDTELRDLKEQVATLKSSELSLKRQVQILTATVEKLKADIDTRITQFETIRQSERVIEGELKAKAEQVRLLHERISVLEHEAHTKEETNIVLTQKLEALQIELKLGGARLGEQNERVLQEVRAKEEMIKKLQEQLATLEKVAAAAGGDQSGLQKRIEELEAEQNAREEKLGHLFFHNTCLLVKMMLAKGDEAVSDVFIQDLYDEVKAQSVPMADWPMYIFSRLSA